MNDSHVFRSGSRSNRADRMVVDSQTAFVGSLLEEKTLLLCPQSALAEALVDSRLRGMPPI